jgi:tetratricopeptide (TPR) repeat protein
VLDRLFAAWGGTDRTLRPLPADAELTRLALKCQHAKVLAACAADALRWLDQQSAFKQAADWGQQAVKILEAAGRKLPLELLRRAGETWVTIGEVEAARAAFGQALDRIKELQEKGSAVDPFEHGAFALAQARLLVQSGKPGVALPFFELAQRLAIKRDSERDAVVVMGDIARLKADKGEVEEALRLQTERLETNRRLGDLDSQAATLWDIAQIELGRGDITKAAPLIAEAYAIVDQTGRLEGICAIGEVFGQILIAAGQREEGLAVLHRSEEGFRRMGRTANAEQIAALIRQLEPG